MARLEAVADCCHTPTPVDVCRRLSRFLDISGNAHAIDPCCGTGLAMAALLPETAKSYGIELDVTRAGHAAKRMGRVLTADTQECRISHGAFGVLFLNPPYSDSVLGRLEQIFLERATWWLRPGGVMVYIVKRDHYTMATCSYLAKHFTDFRHWRFPDPYYDGPDLAYTQTVLVCRRKFKAEIDPKAAAALRADIATLEPLPEWSEPPADRYRVPPGIEPTIFLPGQLGAEQMAELIAKSGIRRVPKQRSALAGRPPLPLKTGHQALVLASGLVNGVYGQGDERHVAKGTVQRTTKEKKTLDVAGGAPALTVRTTHGFEVVIRAILGDGSIHTVAGQKEETTLDPQIAEVEESEEAA